MANLTPLESYSKELATAVKTLASYTPTHEPLLDPNARKEVHRAQGRILSSVAAIKTLIYGPTDFLEHLAIQCEILASLRWLGEFQILACIPLTGSVPIKDVADLTNVPENHLARIIRLTATASFLHEPELGLVAHTSLSASFVANPSFLDAAMFLAESAAPAALHMAAATKTFGDSERPAESAFNLAANQISPFHTVREQTPRLNRRWYAYLHHAAGLLTENDDVDILAQLNWSNVTNAGARIVEVGAHSTSMARLLAEQFPSLHLLVQMSEPASIASNQNAPSNELELDLDPRITVTTRAPGTRQTANGTAVYILHLPSPTRHEILAELQAHLPALRSSSGVMIILTARLLPGTGSASDSVNDAIARSRDLILHQMANEGELEMAALLEMIDTVRDTAGKLVVTNKLRSRRNVVVALVVKFQADCAFGP